jgi:hypothetical protein
VSDYGHELLFGSSLTPGSARPGDAVALAQLCEQIGLNLASFQDHPYQPAYSTPRRWSASSRAYRHDPPVRQRHEPAVAAPAMLARSPGEPRPAQRRPGRVRPGFLRSARGPLRGPAEQWSEDLADLALTDGISAFILGSDQPDDLRRFAAEVAPAVREMVAAERTSHSGEPAPRRPSVRGADLRATTDVSGALAVTPTPDDGVRRSDVLVWDESTCPEGLPVDPERGYTSNERASGKYLVDIHDGPRAELAEIYRLIEQVAAGSMDAGSARAHLNTMTMRQNNWLLGT